MTFYEKIQKIFAPLNIEFAYGVFREGASLPYAIYMMDGAETFLAENEIYCYENHYHIEYYFKNKDEELERKIEQGFTDQLFIWEKSEDLYIEEDGIFAIYYYLSGYEYPN